MDDAENETSGTASLNYGEVDIEEDVAIEAFQKLADGYFKQNFGTMMKSEIDLIMFECIDDAFNKKIDNDNSSDNGSDIGNLKVCTDYMVARQLALTPQRVQNLRTKSALRRAKDEAWTGSFLRVLQRNTYEMVKQPGKRTYLCDSCFLRKWRCSLFKTL